jgi:hypothetical protein
MIKTHAERLGYEMTIIDCVGPHERSTFNVFVTLGRDTISNRLCVANSTSIYMLTHAYATFR